MGGAKIGAIVRAHSGACLLLLFSRRQGAMHSRRGKYEFGIFGVDMWISRQYSVNIRLTPRKPVNVTYLGRQGAPFVSARDNQIKQPSLASDDIHAPARIGHVAEEELARLLRARSVVAWETLFERHYDRVYRYGLARLCSREAADDVAAATFDRALATIDSYSYRGRPTLAWLYGIARNVVNETRRSDMRQRATGLVESLLRHDNGNRPSNAFPPFQTDGTERLVSRMDLDHAMRRLTQIQREVVMLRYFAGLSAFETSQVMGRPETAVYALQARALAALRRQLA